MAWAVRPAQPTGPRRTGTRARFVLLYYTCSPAIGWTVSVFCTVVGSPIGLVDHTLLDPVRAVSIG